MDELSSLALQRIEISKQLRNVAPSDTFARMLLIGKLKDILRKMDALAPDSSWEDDEKARFKDAWERFY